MNQVAIDELRVALHMKRGQMSEILGLGKTPAEKEDDFRRHEAMGRDCLALEKAIEVLEKEN